MNEVIRSHKSENDINMKDVYDEVCDPKINYEVRLRSNVEAGADAVNMLRLFFQTFSSFPKRHHV